MAAGSQERSDLFLPTGFTVSGRNEYSLSSPIMEKEFNAYLGVAETYVQRATNALHDAQAFDLAREIQNNWRGPQYPGDTNAQVTEGVAYAHITNKAGLYVRPPSILITHHGIEVFEYGGKGEPTQEEQASGGIAHVLTYVVIAAGLQYSKNPNSMGFYVKTDVIRRLGEAPEMPVVPTIDTTVDHVARPFILQAGQTPEQSAQILRKHVAFWLKNPNWGKS